jgi:hypothetical protein
LQHHRLISHNRERDGLQILQRLHVRKGDPSDIAAKEEYYQIRKQIELEAQTGVTTMLGMFKRRSYLKRIACGSLVQYVCPEMRYSCARLTCRVGLPPSQLEFWSSTIIRCFSTATLAWRAGYLLSYVSPQDIDCAPRYCTNTWCSLDGVYTSWAAFLNWVNSLLLDRVGRRPVIIIGLTGCILMITIYTAMVAEYAGTDNKAGNAMGVLFLFLFVTFYGSSQDASSYVYCSEIFPTNVRAQGLSVAIAVLFGS